MTLNRGPIDSITNGFTAATEDRKWVKSFVGSEDLLPVVCGAHVVRRYELFTHFIDVLNRRLIGGG